MIGIRSHTFVDQQLNSWGVYKRWLEKGSGVPGPKRLRSWWGPMVTDRLLQGHGNNRSAVDHCPVNIDEARAMDACIAKLASIDFDLHQAVVECWHIGGTVEQQAEACHCAIGTYYKRLDRAKFALLGLLNDEAAGVLVADCGVS